MEAKGTGQALALSLFLITPIFLSTFYNGRQGEKAAGYLHTVSRGFYLKGGKARVSLFPGIRGEGVVNLLAIGACKLEVRRNFKKVYSGSTEGLKRIKLHLSFSPRDRVDVSFAGRACVLLKPDVIVPGRGDGPVFLVVADTLRWDSLGVYNPESKATPEIDRFSRDAVVFKWAFSTSPWTLPSHASMLSGKYPYRISLDLYPRGIPPDVKLLPELLGRDHRSFSVNGDIFLRASFGFFRGFYAYIENLRDPYIRESAKLLFKLSRDFSPYKGDFYFLHTYQVHNDYRPEFPLALRFWKEVGRFPRDSKINLLGFLLLEGFSREWVPPAIKDEIRLIYDAGVYTFDYRFGEFLRWLKAKGLYEDSTIILTSDHGEEFQDHGGWEHGHSLYNELIRVPLIVKFPHNRWAGHVETEPVSLVDIAPTVLEIVGLEPPPDMDGVPLPKTITGGVKGRRIFSYLGEPSYKVVRGMVAVIDWPWKLIMKNGKRKEFELFDLKEDPLERKNLLKNHPEVFQRLAPLLREIPFLGRFSHKRNLSPDLLKKLRSLGYVR